jgi:hypothetical protein
MNQLIIRQKKQLRFNATTYKFISDHIESTMHDIEKIKKKYLFIPTLKQSTKYPTLNETIKDFALLQPNWDSYNADAISKTAIKIAHRVLQYLNNEDYIFDEFEINVFPMRDGGIQYEFDKKQESAELEISPSGDLQFIRYDHDGNIVSTKNLPVYELSELSSLLEETDHA